MVRIFEDDDYKTIAKKIFEEFEVNQSCSIRGFLIIAGTEDVIPKGNEVINELRILDEKAHTHTRTNDGRRRRVNKMPKDAIGGYLAHKIFRFKQEERESGIVTSIWRIQ